MSKLANLKSWLTLSDTTQYLSEKLKENVSQAELFRLAMDGDITLSIRILEPTMSNIGQAVKADKAETMMSDQVEWPSYLTIRVLPEKPYVIFTSPKLEHGLFFKKERFDFVSGIFDLRWGDGVSLTLRNKYQQLTGGALFDEWGSGCYLSDAEGNIYELLGLRAGKEVMTGSDKEVKANCFATGLPVDSEICARIENLNLFVDQINQAEEIKTINNEIASSSIESLRTFNEFKSQLSTVVEKYPIWRLGQSGRVHIGSRLLPWVVDEVGMNERQAQVILPMIKEAFPEDF
jgi:hypothetical protein